MARSELGNYSNKLSNIFKREVKAINKLVSAYIRADFHSERGISRFQSKLNSNKVTFNSFLISYNIGIPADADEELREIIDIAYIGTRKIYDSLKIIEIAMKNHDNTELQHGYELLKSGSILVHSAILKYKSWVRVRRF